MQPNWTATVLHREMAGPSRICYLHQPTWGSKPENEWNGQAPQRKTHTHSDLFPRGIRACPEIDGGGNPTPAPTCRLDSILLFRRPLGVDFAADMIEGEKQVMLGMKVDGKLSFNLK